MNRIISIVISILLITTSMQAQDAGEFKIGIKAGLNFATILGPKEQDTEGSSVESRGAITRFHLGPTFKYAFTDKNGLMLEVLYSQRGGKYVYDGDSYYLFDRDGTPAFFKGRRIETINVNNGYLDIPIMFYYKATQNISLYGGGYLGFLLNSTGSGPFAFDADAQNFEGEPTDLSPINIEMDHNYIQDQPGETPTESDTEIPENITTGGQQEQFNILKYPSVVGAYTDFDTKDGSFYNPLDAGLVAGLEFQFDTGLVFGLRGTYGLLDATNNFYDVSKVNPMDAASGDYSPVLRSDKDVNFNIQLSVGFEF